MLARDPVGIQVWLGPQGLVDGLENLNLHLASRNRPDVKMVDAGSLNAYEVLNHRWIVASEPSVRSLAEVLS